MFASLPVAARTQLIKNFSRATFDLDWYILCRVIMACHMEFSNYELIYNSRFIGARISNNSLANLPPYLSRQSARCENDHIRVPYNAFARLTSRVVEWTSREQDYARQLIKWRNWPRHHTEVFLRARPSFRSTARCF